VIRIICRTVPKSTTQLVGSTIFFCGYNIYTSMTNIHQILTATKVSNTGNLL